MNRATALETAKQKAFENGVPYYCVQKTQTAWNVLNTYPKVRVGTKIYKVFPSSLDSGMVQDACGDWISP